MFFGDGVSTGEIRDPSFGRPIRSMGLVYLPTNFQYQISFVCLRMFKVTVYFLPWSITIKNRRSVNILLYFQASKGLQC